MQIGFRNDREHNKITFNCSKKNEKLMFSANFICHLFIGLIRLCYDNFLKIEQIFSDIKKDETNKVTFRTFLLFTVYL